MKFHCTKMKFSIKDFFSECDQILNGKLHFSCSVFVKDLFSKYEQIGTSKYKLQFFACSALHKRTTIFHCTKN